MIRRPLLVLPVSLVAASCGERTASAASAEVTESAGVRLVVNTLPGEAEGTAWRLSGEPRLEIGVAEGEEAYQLFRVNSGAVLSDGTVVLANGGTFEVRLFDADGRHLRTTGGRGQGPCEVGSVEILGVMAGDSLLLFDRSTAPSRCWSPTATSPAPSPHQPRRGSARSPVERWRTAVR